MTYIKKNLPSLSQIQEEYEKMGHLEFVNFYRKYDTFIGDSESIEFLNSIINTKTTNTNNQSSCTTSQK